MRSFQFTLWMAPQLKALKFAWGAAKESKTKYKSLTNIRYRTTGCRPDVLLFFFSLTCPVLPHRSTHWYVNEWDLHYISKKFGGHSMYGSALTNKSCSRVQRLIFQTIMINASAKYYEPVVSGEWMCQSILHSSILPGVPSDKHMAGKEPRGIWTTTDAIQATLCLLGEPDWEEALKTRALKRNKLERGFSLMARVY